MKVIEYGILRVLKEKDKDRKADLFKGLPMAPILGFPNTTVLYFFKAFCSLQSTFTGTLSLISLEGR